MNADFLTNQIGTVLVVVPTNKGRVAHISEHRQIVFERDGNVLEAGLTRWIFADIPSKTLTDNWNNTYDHQVHFLLAGTLQAGKEFVAELKEQGFLVEQAERLFVPFQTLDPHNQVSSDQLRQHHPRAFALARQDQPNTHLLITALRDSIVIGST